MVVVPRRLDVLASHEVEMEEKVGHLDWFTVRKTGIGIQFEKDGALVLLTTHSMEEAEALCDRVGIIQSGKVLALDTVPNLLTNYGFQFKATYFHSGSAVKPNSQPVTMYGADDQELVAIMKEKGINQFSVKNTSLEDVYLNMTGGLEGFDGRDG